MGFMTYRAVVVVVAGLSRPRAWAVCRMVTKGTTATRARVSAKVRMVRFGSSFVDLTGEKGTIPTDEVGCRCGMSPGEAKGIETRGSLDLPG